MPKGEAEVYKPAEACRIAEGRFDDGLAPAPPIAEQRKPAAEESPKKSGRVPAKPEAPPPLLRVAAGDGEKEKPAPRPVAAAPDFDRKSVVRELRDIVRLIDHKRVR